MTKTNDEDQHDLFSGSGQEPAADIPELPLEAPSRAVKLSAKQRIEPTETPPAEPVEEPVATAEPTVPPAKKPVRLQSMRKRHPPAATDSPPAKSPEVMPDPPPPTASSAETLRPEPVADTPATTTETPAPTTDNHPPTPPLTSPAPASSPPTPMASAESSPPPTTEDTAAVIKPPAPQTRTPTDNNDQPPAATPSPVAASPSEEREQTTVVPPAQSAPHHPPPHHPRPLRITGHAGHHPTRGQLLQEARVRCDYSLDQVAQATRIKGQFLEALERDDVDNLPPEVYVKAYVRRLCHHYGLDENDVFSLALAPPPKATEKAVPNEILHHLEEGKQVNPNEERKIRHLVLSLVATVCLLLVAVAGIYWGGRWRTTRGNMAQRPSSATETTAPALVPTTGDAAADTRELALELERRSPPGPPLVMSELPLPKTR